MSKLENFSTHKPREDREDDRDRPRPKRTDRKVQGNCVTVEDGMSIDKALSMLKQACQKSGLTAEVRKRAFHVKPSEERREQERSRQKAIAKNKKKEDQKDQAA